MKTKRMTILSILCLILALFPAWAEGNDAAALQKDVVVLFTSDVHCAVDQGWGYGGIYAVRQSFARDNHVLLVDDGDAVQGEAIGLMTKGEAIVDIMNAEGIDGRPVRIIQNAETNLGDLCADAYLNHFEGADIAMANGSGIRADLNRGDITCNDVLTVLPYGTKLDLIEVRGRQVLDALEWSVHAIPEEFGGFEHVAGLTFEFDPDIPSPCVSDGAGLFVRVDEVMPRRVRNVRVGSDPLDPEGTYRLVTNDYILMDGDGFTMFRGASLLENGAEDSQALLEYIVGPLGGVIGEAYAQPYGQGRMVSVR